MEGELQKGLCGTWLSRAWVRESIYLWQNFIYLWERHKADFLTMTLLWDGTKDVPACESDGTEKTYRKFRSLIASITDVSTSAGSAQPGVVEAVLWHSRAR